jgi:hypothetical protein
MKKSYKIVTPILAIIFILSFSTFSCSDSYNVLFADLNENFIEVGEIKLTPKIGDEDFNESMMLPNFQYTVNKNTSLCLTAPLGAETYEWKIELPSDDTNTRTLIKRSVSQSSTLYYTPTEQIKIGTLYILTLNATTKEGTVYTDDAEVIFYE